MLFRMEKEGARKKAYLVMMGSGVRVTEKEMENLLVEDYGCNNLKTIGSQRVVYLNDAVYAAEVVLFPGQTRPELRHPGRDVTFRCREGKVYVYTEGEQPVPIKAKLPKGKNLDFTVFCETELNPGEQITIPAGKKYWLQGAENGALLLELSGPYDAGQDVFTGSSYRVTVLE